MSDIDCRTCKGKYKECIGKKFYAVGDIKYCPLQVLWMIEHFFWLSSDGIMRTEMDWPDDPDSNEAELPNVQRPKRAGSYFEKSIDAIAELAIRLKNSGHSGELLLAELQAGMEGYLTDEADAVLHYITGFRRKLTSFNVWKAVRKNRKSYHFITPNPPISTEKSKLVTNT